MTMKIDRGGVLDALPVMAWTALPDGNIDFVNRRWSDYTGLSLNQGRGWEWQAAVEPGDLPQLLDSWRSILASGEPGEMEARVRRFDGQYRWFRIQCNPMRDEAGHLVKWCGVATDVEDFRRAEQTLRRRELDFQVVVDSIPVPVAVTTPTGEVEGLNQPTLSYFGETLEDLKGWKASDVVHPDDVERTIAAQLEAHRSGSAYNVESRHRRADGVYRWFNVLGMPLRDRQGNILRWLHLLIDIDDRKRAEEALREGKEIFRTIVETTPECVKVIARDGTVLRVNAAGAAMAGVSSPDAVVGLNFFEFLAPEHRARYREFHENICMGQKGFLEFDLINAQGVRRHMETHAAPMRRSDGTIVQLGVTRDITERKQAEEKLRRSEAFLAEGQNLARMGNLSWRVTTGEIVWSEQLYGIFNFEPGTVVTVERVCSRVHPEDLPLMADMVERAKRGEDDFEYQHRIILPDGSLKYLHLIAHLARGDAGEIEYIGAVLDITQRRLAEEGLAKARSELAHVARVSSLGALTASIAHEVNQPLSGIITNASTCLRMLAADPPNVEGASETARRTIRDGNRAADVIARLRALFSKRNITIEPLDLNEAVREVIALSWDDLQRGRVILSTELADGLPVVGGDRIQLQQVIMNLLRNASDAMSGVDDRPRRLLIRTGCEEHGQVRLSVEDAGIGFGPQGTDRLFEAFYTTKRDGMGIGLSVSRSIIESHGGRLWAQANDGPGATFTFSIPVGDGAPARGVGLARMPITSNTRRAVGIP
jgi:PAS domain S-box-containing protein